MSERGRIEERRRVRQVRRAAQPVLPFVPWGLAPAIGLALVVLAGIGPVARWQVEDVARDTASDALRAAGLGWVVVEASGQRVSLSGAPPTPGAGDGAEAVVSAATATTWAGALIPATLVTTRFDAQACPPGSVSSAPAAAAASGTASPPVAVEAAPAAWDDWTFQRDAGGILTLSGVVPDDAAAVAIRRAAQAQVAAGRVVEVRDQLVISGHPGSDGLTALGVRGVDTVAGCDTGAATLRGGQFSLRCELARAAEPAVRERASAAVAVGSVGTIDLLVTDEIVACEAALQAVLASATIVFPPMSATIGAGSEPLLDAVAAEAARCPGTLRVEGHTDTKGPHDYNVDLSRKRAEAVRAALVARGIPTERLVAEGFGPDRPRADNATAKGRASNRRIEVRVVRSTEPTRVE